ncbi:MAG TPA: hypothetical protein VIF12_04560, partial [Micavibrio sp.]
TSSLLSANMHQPKDVEPISRARRYFIKKSPSYFREKANIAKANTTATQHMVAVSSVLQGDARII